MGSEASLGLKDAAFGFHGSFLISPDIAWLASSVGARDVEMGEKVTPASGLARGFLSVS